MNNLLILSLLLLFPYVSFSAPTKEYIQRNAIENTGGDIAPEAISVLEKYRIVAIGELHGNDTTPLLAGKVASALSQIGDVTLAIEIEKANQYGLEEYMRTGNKYILRLLAHFARDYQDGRSSLAMIQLLDMVRKNRRIHLLAFDTDFHSSPQDRDTKMAENIIKSAKEYPDRPIVILAGNIHSSIKVGNLGDDNYKPMAYQLFSLQNSPINPTDVLSVIARHQHARIWACTNDIAADCGPMKLKVDSSTYSSAVNYQSYFLLEPSLSEEGYWATLYTRSVDLSPPFR